MWRRHINLFFGQESYNCLFIFISVGVMLFGFFFSTENKKFSSHNFDCQETQIH